jgi:hypothetical protein
MTNFEILKSGFLMSRKGLACAEIAIMFKTEHEALCALDALMALMRAAIDTPIDKSGVIGADFVNVESVHDFGVDL